MKKIIIVNNNMKVGGVQKSLYNLLWSIADQYDITLYLFASTGEYLNDLPASVKVKLCTSLFRYLGISQNECKNIFDYVMRGILAALCRVFGRPLVIKIMALSQKQLPESYDIAISYLQNGNLKSFYGGVNEFVLQKIQATLKIAFLHCDYSNCGADNVVNNKLYYSYDKIAACSDGCRNSFLRVMPDLQDTCVTVKNFQRVERIRELAFEKPVQYDENLFNVLVVGRLAHEKGVERAIRAVAYALTQQIPISIHIVGDGNRMQLLQELTVSLGIHEAVHFYGEQSNPYRYMVNADLLLITSYHEAAPMVIDEARAVGLPVLTVETTSSREMVFDQHCGWICDNSQEGINQCLVDVLSHGNTLAEIKKSLKEDLINNTEAFEQFQMMIGELNESTTADRQINE